MTCADPVIFVLGGGGRTEYDKKCFVNLLVLKLIYSGFNVLNLFTEGSSFTFKENCTFCIERGSNISQGRVGSNSIAQPYRTCDFQGESGPPPPPPPHTHTPPLWVRASLIPHKIIGFHVLIMSYV